MFKEMLPWLTQLDVLVVGEDEDDVGPDVAPVPLEPRLHPLAGEEDGGLGHRRHGQQHRQQAHLPAGRHDNARRPHTPDPTSRLLLTLPVARPHGACGERRGSVRNRLRTISLFS